MRSRAALAVVVAGLLAVAAPRALVQERPPGAGGAGSTPARAAAPSSPPDEVLLSAAPGALFGVHVAALDVAAGTLALARTYDLRSARGYEGDPPSIDVLEIGEPGAAPRILVRLGDRPAALALEPSGARVVVAFEQRVRAFSTADGAPIFDVAVEGARGVEIAADGTAALAVDRGVVLLAPDGTERARHDLLGTASDVMRIYTGEHGPTYHETHPVDVPAQPVAMAFAADGRLAVSTTDGALHVVRGARVRRLGPAPDPGGMMEEYPRIVTASGIAWRGESVRALVGSGALLSFDVASGRVRTLDDGRCAPAEIEALLEMFPGDRSDRTVYAYCQSAGLALFSAGGRVVVDGSSGMRVRSARTGAGVEAFETLDGPPMALDGEDRLVATNAEGLLRVHALPSGRVTGEEPRAGAAGTIAIHPERDLVLVSVGPTLPSDPSDERPWTSRAYHLDGTPRPGLDLSGVSLAVATGADRVAIATHEPFALRLCDLEGRTIRELGAALPAAEYFALAIAPDGRAVAVARDGALFWIADDGATRALGTGEVVTQLALDRAGARLAVVRFDGDTFTHAVEVLDVASGRVLFFAPSGAAVALSPDGTRIALHEAGTGTIVVRRVEDGAEVARLSNDLGASGLSIGPDGAVYFARTLEGLMRWAFPAAPVALGLGALGPDALRFTSSGAVVVEDAHFGAHVLRARDGAHLASVHALVTGGFAVIARTGAVDGSSDAAGAFLARRGETLTRGLDAAALAAVRVPGLLAWALRGEDVPRP